MKVSGNKMIKGSIVALVTPFNKDGSVNFDKLKELFDYHIKNHTDGICLLGTTGEATTISHEEQVEVVKFGVKYLKGKVTIVVGAGSNDTYKSVAFA